MACAITVVSVSGVGGVGLEADSVTVKGTAEGCSRLKLTLACEGDYREHFIDDPEAEWQYTFDDLPDCAICGETVSVKAECERDPSCSDYLEGVLECTPPQAECPTISEILP